MTRQAPQASPPQALQVDDVLAQLEAVRRVAEGRWMARCPAHGDGTASLSIRAGDDGKVLLHCFAGCTFAEVVAAIGVRPEQLFPVSPPGPRRPRRPALDPDAELRAYFEHLCHLRDAPPPERVRKELRLVGRLLLGGTDAFAELPPTFRSESFRTFSLRIVFEAMAEVAKQGTPRRWFSPLALARELERVGGGALRRDVFWWRRIAIAAARFEP